MMKSRIITRVLTLVTLALCACLSRADIVTLKDGSTFEGTVVKENGAQVVLETTISNIKTTKTFPRYKVRSVEYKPVEEVVEDKPEPSIKTNDAPSTPEPATPEPRVNNENQPDENQPDESTPADDRADRPDPVPAMQITIRGILGEETNARALRAALGMAAKEEIEHIVLFIDCERGYLYDSLAMLKLLDEYHKRFTYYAFVNKDLPTSAFVFIAAADRVFVNPRSQLGGDMDYSTGAFGGNEFEEPYRADLPFRDKWSSALLAAAEQSKKDPSFFKTDSETSEKPIKNAHGEQIVDERTGRPAIRKINRFWVPQTTGQALIDAGIAQPITGTPSKLGESLGIEGWRLSRAMADRAMREDSQAAEKIADRFARAHTYLSSGILQFLRNDPRQRRYQLSYPRDQDGRYRFDLEPLPAHGELRAWQNYASDALSGYKQFSDAYEELTKIVEQGQKLGMLHALMPQMDPAYRTRLKARRDWIEHHREEIPSEYLQVRSIKNSNTP